MTRDSPERLPQEGEWLVQGVWWTQERIPTLRLVDIGQRLVRNFTLLGERLAFMASDARYCLGSFRVVNRMEVEVVACHQRRQVEQGSQCAACRELDQFGMAHIAHRRPWVPDELRQYLQQQHHLYVATFPSGLSKVGTAASTRKISRLDEQGPLLATHVATTEDGIQVRFLEDAVSSTLGLRQAATGSMKQAAWSTPPTAGSVASRHLETVEKVKQLIHELDRTSVQIEQWKEPQAYRLLTSATPRSIYPVSLITGEHGFTVDACAGSSSLVTPSDADVRFVVNLGQLKGRRVTFGEFQSPELHSQGTLF